MGLRAGLGCGRGGPVTPTTFPWLGRGFEARQRRPAGGPPDVNLNASGMSSHRKAADFPPHTTPPRAHSRLPIQIRHLPTHTPPTHPPTQVHHLRAALRGPAGGAARAGQVRHSPGRRRRAAAGAGRGLLAAAGASAHHCAAGGGGGGLARQRALRTRRRRVLGRCLSGCSLTLLAF